MTTRAKKGKIGCNSSPLDRDSKKSARADKIAKGLKLLADGIDEMAREYMRLKGDGGKRGEEIKRRYNTLRDELINMAGRDEDVFSDWPGEDVSEPYEVSEYLQP